MGEVSTESIGDNVGMCAFLLELSRYVLSGGEGVTDRDSSRRVYLSLAVSD